MKNKTVIALFILLCVFTTNAFAQSAFEGASGSGTVDSWKITSEDGVGGFWANLNQDENADVYFAFFGVNYRRVVLDTDSDRHADMVCLPTPEKRYLFFIKNPKSNRWTEVSPTGPLDSSSKLSSGQKLIQQGVARRIFMDDHPDLWRSSTSDRVESKTAIAIDTDNTVQRYFLRLTKTPSEKTVDPDKAKKPMPLPEGSFSVVSGQEETLEREDRPGSFSSPGFSKPAFVSMMVKAFVLPVDATSLVNSPVDDVDILSLCGQIRIDNKKTFFFCALIPVYPGGPASVTVAANDASGKNNGNIFIEVFKQKAQ